MPTKLTKHETALLSHSLSCTRDEYSGADLPKQAVAVCKLAAKLGVRLDRNPEPILPEGKGECLAAYREGMRDAWQVVATSIQKAGADYGLAVSSVQSPASDAHGPIFDGMRARIAKRDTTDLRTRERELFEFAQMLLNNGRKTQPAETGTTTDLDAVCEMAEDHPELVRLLALYYHDARTCGTVEGEPYTQGALKTYDRMA